MVEVAVEDESNGVEGERISGKKNMKHNTKDLITFVIPFLIPGKAVNIGDGHLFKLL